MDISHVSDSSADEFFRQLEERKSALQTSWNHITQTLNNALHLSDHEALLGLIPYMEQGEGALAYEYTGESRRLLRILHFIQLELRYQKTPFSSDCTDKDSLLEKYMLALFALRRLSFRLSASSMEEAAVWLQHNKPSVFAVYVITREELITPDKALYNTISEVCFPYWTADEQQLFISLTAGN